MTEMSKMTNLKRGWRVEARQRKLVQRILAAAILWAGTAHAQPGTASGNMTVNGNVFALRHAYASVQRGFFDPKSEDVRILLTDIPLDEPSRTDMSVLTRLGRSGKLHAVEVVVDAKGSPMTGALFLEAFNGMASVAGMHQFDAKALERKLVEGRMFTDGPRTFAGITWQYDVTFSASIVRPPTAAETAAALASPAGRAAVAHVEAIFAGFDAFIATLTEKSAASFRAPGGRERFDEIRGETPAGSRVVTLVDGPDDTRIATMQGKRRDGVMIESSMKLRQEGGAWKVDR
jgi:hypothetical protein